MKNFWMDPSNPDAIKQGQTFLLVSGLEGINLIIYSEVFFFQLEKEKKIETI